MTNQSELKEFLNYNPESGILTWIKDRGHRKIGDVCACHDKHGYIVIRFKGKLYKAHRLAWLLHYGNFPVNHLDHINGVRDDNRITNLRDATDQQNQRNRTKCQVNSKTQTLGVRKHHNKFVAQIGGVEGKTKYLGCFPTIEQAHQAYLEAKKVYHIL